MNIRQRASFGVLMASASSALGLSSTATIRCVSADEASSIRGAQATQCYTTYVMAVGAPACTDVCTDNGCMDPITVAEQTPTQTNGSSGKNSTRPCGDDATCSYPTTTGNTCVLPTNPEPGS